MHLTLLCLVLGLVFANSVEITDVNIVHYQPEQVHLSFGGKCH